MVETPGHRRSAPRLRGRSVRPRSRPRGRCRIHEFHGGDGRAFAYGLLLRLRPQDDRFSRRSGGGRAAARGARIDLRLLVLLAKLAILNRDISGFARWVGAIAWLVDNHWDDAHPRAEDGDYAARLVAAGDARRRPGRRSAAAIRPARRNPARGRAHVSRPADRDRRSQTAGGEPRQRVRRAETSVEETFASARRSTRS